ncbi:hypothetical protein Cus16_2473 [Curtobacterium sp. ER1/6]|nr:hypothetical protein Cus16_2473 [Curtobacterium sp. ER1/6]
MTGPSPSARRSRGAGGRRARRSVRRHPPDADAWFGVRCVFRHGESRYEERVVIVRADDFALAIARAEDEAARYAVDVDAEYLGLAQAFALVDDPGDGAEVFSLMRDSDLPPDEYLDAFFDTGDERQGGVGAASGRPEPPR